MEFANRWMRPSLPGLVVLMVVLCGACATGPAEDEGPAVPGLLAHAPSPSSRSADASIVATAATVFDSGELQISFRDEDREITVLGSLRAAQGIDASEADPLRPGFLPPVVAFEAIRPEAHRDAGGGKPVSVRSVQEWQELILRLQQEIVGLVSNRGVVLDVLQQAEIVLYVDEQGALRAVPLEDKPRNIEPTRFVSLTGLLQDAVDRVRQSLQQQGGNTPYLLYNTGDLPDTGFPFVFMDLERGRVFFIQKTPGSDRVLLHGPAGTLNATFHVIASQARSLSTRPLSSFGRLVSGLGSAAVDTLQPTPTWDQPGSAVPPLADAANMDPDAWEQELDALTGGRGTYGQIRYLVDGEAFFPALIRAIGEARESIRMRLYIFDNDDYGLKIGDLLRRRSREIPVQIMVDGFGTIAGGMARPEYTPQHSAPAPVSIARYLRTDSDISLRMLANPWLHGDHSKVIILDDTLAFLGGMNIGREYRYEWHDLMVQASGPVVDELIRDFENTWAQAGMLGDLQAILRRSRHPVRRAGDDDYPVRLLYTRPGDSQIRRTQIAAMRNARSRIWIHNAYLTSDAVLYELVKARRRGVDVRVILPLQNDSGFIDRSNVLAANVMLRNGIRVYIYPGMSHLKAAIYDGWACLGSANFDRLSLRLNKETNIATSNTGAVNELANLVFDPDFARALELTEPLPAGWLDYLKEMIADHL